MGSHDNVVSEYQPLELPRGHPSFFEDLDPRSVWVGEYSHLCQFSASVFLDKMMNIIENPNLNTTWLFRADIVQEECYNVVDPDDIGPRLITTPQVRDMVCYRALVRRLVPRNAIRDRPMLQTCAFYTSKESVAGENRQTNSNLIIFTSHVEDVAEVPFYHPKVRGIAYMHQWDSELGKGIVSVHFLAYDGGPLVTDCSLLRIAYRLLKTITQHANSPNYEKRVHHDVVVPQKRFQDRYSTLKNKYARTLIEHWAENTDPSKHVFEDLGIAAFLIELWADIYVVDDDEATKSGGHGGFPGFVDIGCGNGLLVYILSQEGFQGWGFDVRERKSWSYYKAHGHGRCVLEERALLPSLITDADPTTKALAEKLSPGSTHNGEFPKGTFIIANHADELTAWTPILAAASESPFIMIPCCSHRLSGDKFRAPAPRDKSKSKSVYSSFVDWVTCIADDCGWVTETEMLRIPSTRNACILGRHRKVNQADGAEAVLALALEGRKDEEDRDQERVRDSHRTKETEEGMMVGDSLAASFADVSLDGDKATGWDVDLDAVIAKYGGAAGYTKSIEKLLVSASGH